MTLILIEIVKTQSERIYDTSEWIPITPNSLKASNSDIIEEKLLPNERVLSLEGPVQQNFYNEQEFNKKHHKPISQAQFLRETSPKKEFEQPRPRKLKFPTEFNFDASPQSPNKGLQHVNYYTGEGISPPYLFEQPLHRPVKKPKHHHTKPKHHHENSYYHHIPVPNTKPQAPSKNAQSIYEQFQLPFNNSFYQSLNPSTINNDLYKAINVNKTKVDENQQPTVEQERVQLVYIPVQTIQQNNENPTKVDQVPLKERLPIQQLSPAAFDPDIYGSLPLTSHSQTYLYPPIDLPKQEKLVQIPEQSRLESIQHDFAKQTLDSQRLQQQFRDDINPIHQEFISTTVKPKRKAHQPPLAVFLESQQNKAEIADVLNILKGAKTIAVQDSVTLNSPQIFIGPSNLDSPQGYTKFPLPYLNNINGNRIERKIDQLPFFVAPVTYKAPSGYAKISLPSPHVGSVVVSVPQQIRTTTPEPDVIFQQNPYNFNQGPPLRLQPNLPENYEIVTENNHFQPTLNPDVAETPRYREISHNLPISQPNLDYFNIPIEQQRRPSIQEIQKVPSISSTPKPKQALQLNPAVELLNEFELDQINNEFDEPTNKVKHSTTRRPVGRYNTQADDADNIGTISSTRSPQTRGRFTYDEDFTTERSASRTRTRGRSRKPSTTTSPTTTTSSTTTAAPFESDKYTVLEEFIARDAVGPSTTTENYRISSTTETRTEEPKKVSSTSFSGIPYLPEDSGLINDGRPLYENTRFEPNYEVPQIKEITTDPPRANQQPLVRTEIANEYFPSNIYTLSPQNNNYDSISSYQTPSIYDNVELSANIQPKKEVSSSTPQSTHRFRPETSTFSSYGVNDDNLYSTPKSYQPSSSSVYSLNLEDDDQPSSVDEYSFPQPETYERPPSSTSKPKLKEEKVNEEEFDDENQSFLSNFYQPNFDQTYISLQDQAVRSLLTPNLVPSNTNKQKPEHSNVKDVEIPISSTTEAIVDEVPISSTEAEKYSSTSRAFRTRGRGRPRPTSSPVSSTISSRTPSSTVRRIANRRRPTASRTSTERVYPSSSSTEYYSREDNGGSSSIVQPSRFKTRGRPSHNEILSEKISTTESENNAANNNKEYKVQRVGEEVPHSYMQFEHTVDDGQQVIVTVTPNTVEEGLFNEPQQVYNTESAPVQIKTTTEAQPAIIEYESPRIRANNPIVDIQVSHPAQQHQDNERRLEVTSRRSEEPTYVRYNNIKSGGVLNNNKREKEHYHQHQEQEETTSPRTRGRTRGRSRFSVSTTSTTTSTSRPLFSRITHRPSVAPARTSVQNNEDSEFFGFIRQPNFGPIPITQTTASSKNEETSVRFVGEIRPKYSPRTTTASPTTAQPFEEETPKPRIRSRIRTPSRNTETQKNNERSTDEVTRRTGNTIRTRGRGSYRPVENTKRANEDEEVASQNYPVNFSHKSEIPTSEAFKIALEAADEEESDDDLTLRSSIYKPKFLQQKSDTNSISNKDKPAASDSSVVSNNATTVAVSNEFNKTEDLVLESTQNKETDNLSELEDGGSEVTTVIEEMEKIKIDPNEKSSTEITVPKEPIRRIRKKGTWKLVKHSPSADPLEVSESQSYQSVLNAFDVIEKADPYTRIKTSDKKGNWDNSSSKENLDVKNEDSVSLSAINSFEIDESEATTTSPSTTNNIKNNPSNDFFDSIYEMFGLLENRAVNSTTSNNAIITTSSSASATTEISPTFPVEITEIPSTTEVLMETTIKPVDVENSTTEKALEDVSRKAIFPPSETTKPYEHSAPREIKKISTSTSTEVSHETEICFRGRCIKKKEK